MPVWSLMSRTGKLLWSNKRIFIGLTIIYGLLDIFLANGFGNSNAPQLKQQLSQVFSGNLAVLGSSAVIFADLISSSGGGSNKAAGAYQLFFTIIISLALIWSLRQTVAGGTFRIRDALYKGMTPLVPFVLVLLLVCAQLLPFIVGASIYNMVITHGIAVLNIEKITWGLLFAALTMWSLYMLAASIVALYIVSLPDMTPMQALNNSRGLVRGRRWTVIRKIIFLPFGLLILSALIMLPFIVFATPLAKYVFFLLSIAMITLTHGYMYNLYRDLLDE